MKEKIIEIFLKQKSRYGSVRIYESLKANGEKVSEKTVAKIMREEGLVAKYKKAFRPKTTINNPNDRKSARVYKIEDYRVQKENDVWASDLTYIPTEAGFCYLTVVMDLFNREIKGRDLSFSMEAVHTKDCFLDTVKRAPGRLDKLIFHSDQGSQYCSDEFRSKIKILNVTQSMSRKRNCYDNAFVESFFHSLKNELGIKKFKNMEEVRKEIFEYIDWYNQERLHSSFGYLSPVDYVKRETRCAA